MEHFEYVELNLFCMMILLLMAGRIRIADKSQEQFYLVTLMVGESMLFLFDTLWVLIDGVREFPLMLNYVLNIVYFSLTAYCPYLCLRYFRLSLTGDVFRRRHRFLLELPSALLFLLSCISVKTGWTFFVSEQNRYHRGPLFPIVYVLPLIYMLFCSFSALYYGKKSGEKEKLRRSVLLAGMMLMPVIGSALEMIFPNVTIVCVLITISMVAVVMDFLLSRMTKDTLTQLANRLDLMTTLSDRLDGYDPEAKGKTPLYLLFADVDYFKSINDTYGHLEGDRALCTVANALRAACRENGAYPARISGDEFVVVFSARDDATAEMFKLDVKDAVAEAAAGLPYKLNISAGFTRCEAADRKNIPALIDRADTLLYEEKKNRR